LVSKDLGTTEVF